MSLDLLLFLFVCFGFSVFLCKTVVCIWAGGGEGLVIYLVSGKRWK